MKLEVGRHGRIVNTHCTSEEAVKVLTYLGQQPDWVYAADVVRNVALESGDEIKPRAIRAVALATCHMISSSKGYKHVACATADERAKFAEKLRIDADSKQEHLRVYTDEMNRLHALGMI